MKKELAFAILTIGICQTSLAQRIPVEVMAGTNNHRYQHTIAFQNDSSGFGFFNTSSLQVYKRKQRADEIMSQSYLTYKLAQGIKIAGGAFYATGPGFRPSVSLQLLKVTRSFVLLAAPRVDVWRNPSAELMAFVEYKPRLSKEVGIFSRLQIMENFTGSVHNRSYQHVRLGVEIFDFQFGLATNIDMYGREMAYKTNYGLFFRKVLP